MAKWLLTILFLVATAGNSLAAVSPHLEGDAGCEMRCCYKAHQAGPQSLPAKFCCKLQCEQPASVPATTTTVATTPTQDRAPAAVWLVRVPELAHYLKQARFPHSPTHSINGSSSRFLETGAFLI
jgi:hypothetical protein